MSKPLYAIFVGLLAASMFLPLGFARADQPFQRLLPLLVDLSGWQGKKADGRSMQMSDTSLTTATRDYERGPAQVHASVVIGQAALDTLTSIQSGMKVKPFEDVRGMPVLKAYNSKDKSGTLMVVLAMNAVFSFAYNGIAEEEAVEIADKFDWKALQAVAQAK